MLHLVVTFENSERNRHYWRLKDPDTRKSAEEIKTSLEKLTMLNLFEKDGTTMFQKAVGAKFVEKKETPIFDKKLEEKTKEKPSESEENPTTSSTTGPVDLEQLIHDPRDLILEQKMLQPGLMKQVFCLPEGIQAQDISEMQALSLVLAILPEGGTLEDISVDEDSSPVRINLLVAVKDPPERVQAQSPPQPPPKKKRKRLLERLKRP